MWLYQGVALSLCWVSVFCQECELLSEAELVSPMSGGLLSLALLSTQFTGPIPGAAPRPQVRLHDFNIVCLAAAPALGMFRSASLVANVSCSGVELCKGLDRAQTIQLELECVTINSELSAWLPSDLSASGEVSLMSPADASLDTSLRLDCSSCLSPHTTKSASIPDPLNHCVSCNEECTGMRLCTGESASSCCNFYEQRRCVVGCSPTSLPDQNNFCSSDCGSLDSPSNGGVSLTGTTVGSRAAYTCSRGFFLRGSSLRNCLDIGAWDGDEPVCISNNSGESTNNVATSREGMIIIWIVFGLVLVVIATSVLIGVVLYGLYKSKSTKQASKSHQQKKVDPERTPDPLALIIAQTR